MSMVEGRTVVALVALAVGALALVLAWPGTASADPDHTIVVDTHDDIGFSPGINVDCFGGTGYVCSLRSALHQVDEGHSGIEPLDHVEIRMDVGTISIDPSLGGLETEHPGQVTLGGPDGDDRQVIDGEGVGERLLTARGGGLRLIGLELAHGAAGAVESQSHASIEVVDSVIRDFEADAGAAILVHQADLAIAASAFTDNIANSGDGGAITATQSDVTIESGHFERNAAENGRGGVVHATEGPQGAGAVEISGSEIRTAEAEGSGGALSGHHVIVEDTLITDARSASNGGAITAEASVEVTGSTLTDNEAIVQGGAIGVAEAAVDITASTLSDNEAGSFGGAVRSRGDVTISDSSLLDNTAEVNAGALQSTGGDVVIESSTLAGNEAQGSLAGAVSVYSGHVEIRTSTISDNSAGSYGGGVWLDGYGTSEVVASTVVDNVAATAGSQLHVERPLELERTIVAGGTTIACQQAGDGEVVSAGHNLASDTSCDLDADGDLEDTDPQLSPLATHGGNTDVRMPAEDGPALNAGGDACEGETDQRGVERPQGTACDIGAVEVGAQPQLDRLDGADRVETAIEIASHAYPDGADTVVLATGNDPADSLGAAPLATTVDGPLLLTRASQLEPSVAQALDDLGATDVIAVGGPAAVPQEVVDDVAATGIGTSRVAGANRFETAAEVADEIAARVGARDHALIAASDPSDPDVGWADALAAGSYAGIDATPIMLTATDQLPASTAQRIDGMSTVEIVGGPAVVSTSVGSAIGARADDVSRLAGANRWETAVEVADAAVDAGASPTTVWVATGWNWPDGLAAGAAATVDGGVLVLIDGQELDGSPATRDWIAGAAPSTIRVAGGPVAVSDDAVAALEQLQE